MISFNEKIKQVLVLSLILLLIFLSVRELRLFMPGILGAITLYILSRAQYFQLVYHRKWNKGWAAGFFLLYYLVLLGIPIYFAITLLSPKINALLNNPVEIVNNIIAGVMEMQKKAGFSFFSADSLSGSLDSLLNYIPSLLNSTVNLLTNLIIVLFFLYYMLYHGSNMEKTLFHLIPLKSKNTHLLAAETRRMVRANALGIPLISIIQGLTATLGYKIFGVDDYALWGFITGVFAFFPVVGTMIIWVPIVIYMFATGQIVSATGLLIYSVIVTGNVDYIARITIMKRIGNVHPVVTVLGVIIGLGLFGFIGLIFGPLLVSYIIVLTKIYINEFTSVSLHEITGQKND